MVEIIPTISQKSEFDAVVIEGSRRKPVLVEFGGEWCPDCVVLENAGVFNDIAATGVVEVIRFDVPRSVTNEVFVNTNIPRAREWVQTHPELAQQLGITIPMPTTAEGELVAELAIENYPSVFFYDKGRRKKYFSFDQSVNGRKRKDRAIDSDLVERDPHDQKKRRVKQTGVDALRASIQEYMSRRR